MPFPAPLPTKTSLSARCDISITPVEDVALVRTAVGAHDLETAEALPLDEHMAEVAGPVALVKGDPPNKKIKKRREMN